MVSVGVNLGLVVCMSILVQGAQADAHVCKCLYAGTTLPKALGDHLGNPLIGTSCDYAWDGLPGTKWYKNDTVCPPSKKCEKGCNYLELEWCYVEPGCDGKASFTSTVAPEYGNYSYSYEMCGNPYCWDPWGWDAECPGGKGCKKGDCTCKYEGTTLPEEVTAQTKNPLFGTSCMAWDGMPGTVYYKNKTTCPDSKKCEKGCNYLELEWCYVDPSCTSVKSMKSTLDISINLSYSYEMCGNPYCWDPWGWEEGCPGGEACQYLHEPCKCIFDGKTLPAETAVYAKYDMYGTSCDMAWDGVEGTAFHKNDTVCPDKCKKGCNYLQLEWCYVNRGCKGAKHYDTEIPGLKDKNYSYSYEMCGNKYCWDPYGWEEGCPDGCMSMSCHDVKQTYGKKDCCGAPEKEVVMNIAPWM